MQTCTQKKGGPLSLEWRSKAGVFAFKAMQDTILTLQKRSKGHLLLRLPKKSNIGQLRQHAMSWLMCCRSGIARPTSAWWMGLLSWRKRTGSRLLSARPVSANLHFIWVSRDKRFIDIMSLERFSNLWIIMIRIRISPEKSKCSKKLLTDWREYKSKSLRVKYLINQVYLLKRVVTLKSKSRLLMPITKS